VLAPSISCPLLARVDYPGVSWRADEGAIDRIGSGVSSAPKTADSGAGAFGEGRASGRALHDEGDARI